MTCNVLAEAKHVPPQATNMAPLKRNRKQLSMLHFTKRNAVPPETAPSAGTGPPSKKPIRATPRPTAPPFFKQPMPKPSPPPHSHTIADDAWEVADRLMKGQRLTPKKRAFEDDAPLLEDSDDDFEPDVFTQRISSVRPSSARKSTPTPLRDDRASMTKRSATKANRSEPLGRIPTQQRSVFEEYGLPPKMPPLCSSEDDDDNHVVVFDGEKSSLSGTDNEDERRRNEIDLDAHLVQGPPSERDTGNSSTRRREKEPQSGSDSDDDSSMDAPICTRRGKGIRQSSKRQESGLSSRAVKPTRTFRSRLSIENPSDSQRQHTPSKEISPFREQASAQTPSSRGLVPRTVGRQKCSTGSDDFLETYLTKQSERPRKIRPLFNSDTDESDSEKYICRERRRRGRFKSPSPPSSGLDDSLEDEAPSRPLAKDEIRRAREDSGAESSEGSRSRENPQDPESSDVEIVATPKQRGKIADNKPESSKRLLRSRNNVPTDVDLEESNKLGSCYETPVRTPRNKKGDNCDTDERRNSISRYIETASPSGSPPSKVKKRRRFRRLIVATSSEDEDDMDVPLHGSSFQKGTNKRRQNRGGGTALEGPSGTPKSSEWFHERNIDEFSESSCDTRPTSKRHYVTGAVTRRKRRIARGSSPSQMHPLPVKRNISKSFDRSPDQCKSIGTQRTYPEGYPSTPQVQRPARRDSAEGAGAEITRNVETEVIDLVDEDEEPDEEPEVLSNDCDESPEIDVAPSSGGGSGDRIDSPAFEDNSPPPFNLIALCKNGESIREMKERLGEEVVMDKVTEAQENGREIVGGEELGLTGSYNKSVFDRFSKTVVADQLGKDRAAKSMSEKAFRGECKFHYRGREKDSTTDKRRGSGRRGNWSRSRFAKYRRRRGSS